MKGKSMRTTYLLLIAIISVIGIGGCTSLKGKCIKLDIGEGGSIHNPSAGVFGIDLGTVTGPATFESCPLLPSTKSEVSNAVQ